MGCTSGCSLKDFVLEKLGRKEKKNTDSIEHPNP
jgi:hypothetical protein